MQCCGIIQMKFVDCNGVMHEEVRCPRLNDGKKRFCDIHQDQHHEYIPPAGSIPILCSLKTNGQPCSFPVFGQRLCCYYHHINSAEGAAEKQLATARLAQVESSGKQCCGIIMDEIVENEVVQPEVRCPRDTNGKQRFCDIHEWQHPDYIPPPGHEERKCLDDANR